MGRHFFSKDREGSRCIDLLLKLGSLVRIELKEKLVSLWHSCNKVPQTGWLILIAT